MKTTENNNIREKQRKIPKVNSIYSNIMCALRSSTTVQQQEGDIQTHTRYFGALNVVKQAYASGRCFFNVLNIQHINSETFFGKNTYTYTIIQFKRRRKDRKKKLVKFIFFEHSVTTKLVLPSTRAKLEYCLAAKQSRKKPTGETEKKDTKRGKDCSVVCYRQWIHTEASI